MNPNTPQPTEQPEGVNPQPPVTPTPDFTEPAPAADPVAPTADPFTPTAEPAAPVAEPAATSAPTPPPKNTKKIVLIAGIIAGALILAIIAVIIFLSMTTVSKQDYADAAKQYNEVSAANTALTRNASSLSSSNTSLSESEFDEEMKAAEEAIATLRTENEELGKLKAVRVGEGKELYDAFNEKLKAYLENGESLVKSVNTIRPALMKCDEAGSASDNDARVAAIKACSAAFNEVGDVANPEFKAYVEVLKTAYAEFAVTLEKIVAIENPFGAQYEEYKVLRDEMYDTQDDIREATRTFTDALEKRDDELSVKDSAKALADYLNEQQRK